jgi:ATPase subunit of ABC transporter with duplicated ATPase domains
LEAKIERLFLPSRNQFERALAGFGGTILAVIHDLYFIQNFATKVYGIKDGILTSYEN